MWPQHTGVTAVTGVTGVTGVTAVTGCGCHVIDVTTS